MDEILKAKLSKQLKALFGEKKSAKSIKSIIDRLDQYVTEDISSFRNELPNLMADIIDD